MNRMTSERWQEIERGGGCVDLSDRARFRLTGGDRVRYLNGQVTNDVRGATHLATIQACVTDLKGRVVADVYIHTEEPGEALRLDAEPALREVLGPRLERYIIADDVLLEDVTDETRLWHIFGAAASSCEFDSAAVLKSRRVSDDGLDIWLSSSSPAPAMTGPVLTAAEFETIRILRGVPRYPAELNAEAFPPEAGLDDRVMSYTKGCYIGQEVLSRIRTTGKMPRELVRWEALREDAVVEAGALVSLAQTDTEPKTVGKVTSVAWHPLLRRAVGLAYLKQGSARSDSQLLVGVDKPTIEIKVKNSQEAKQ